MPPASPPLSPIDPIDAARQLIRCPSVTPKDEGALDLVESWLVPLGFRCHRLPFGEVDNLYARLGETSPHFSFAGHTDVVPAGDEAAWRHPPFAAIVEGGRLYGRGASDMKGAVAAFIAALRNYLAANSLMTRGSISLLITGDEEGEAKNGTREILRWLARQGETLEDCLIGEPTNPKRLGEMIKIGRRGSLNAELEIVGVQGHAANPQWAANPLRPMARILRDLQERPLDEATEHFAPSNLEITSVDVGNEARNVIPGRARAFFNIRYNDRQTAETLERFIRGVMEGVLEGSGCRAELTLHHSGECFLGREGRLHGILPKVVEAETGFVPEFSTTGGTSDARFIKDYASTIEFGLTAETIHKVGENAALEDLECLTRIYEGVLESYFS